MNECGRLWAVTCRYRSMWRGSGGGVGGWVWVGGTVVAPDGVFRKGTIN